MAKPANPALYLRQQAESLAALVLDAGEEIVRLFPDNHHANWAVVNLKKGPDHEFWTGAAQTVILLAFDIVMTDGKLDTFRVARAVRNQSIADLVDYLRKLHDPVWLWALSEVDEFTYKVELFNRNSAPP